MNYIETELEPEVEATEPTCNDYIKAEPTCNDYIKASPKPEPEAAEPIDNYIDLTLTQFINNLIYKEHNYNVLLNKHGKEIILKNNIIFFYNYEDNIIILLEDKKKGYIIEKNILGIYSVNKYDDYELINLINNNRYNNKNDNDIMVDDIIMDYEKFEKDFSLEIGEFKLLNIDNLIIYKYSINNYILLSHSEEKGYKITLNKKNKYNIEDIGYLFIRDFIDSIGLYYYQ